MTKIGDNASHSAYLILTIRDLAVTLTFDLKIYSVSVPVNKHKN